MTKVNSDVSDQKVTKLAYNVDDRPDLPASRISQTHRIRGTSEKRILSSQLILRGQFISPRGGEILYRMYKHPKHHAVVFSKLLMKGVKETQLAGNGEHFAAKTYFRPITNYPDGEFVGPIDFVRVVIGTPIW